MTWKEQKKKDLLALPYIPSSGGVFLELLIIPRGTKHDSGYSRIAIVALDNERKPLGIVGEPDDIHWKVEHHVHPLIADFQMDCSYPSGILHVWGNRISFKVGFPSSSQEIAIVERYDRPAVED